MNFKIKLLFGIVVVFVFFYLVSDFFTKKIIFSRFEQLEHDYALSDAGRIIYVINDSFSSLDEIVNDWATWDDTYTFVKDQNPQYKKSNLVRQTFENLHVNIMIFSNEKCQPVFSQEFDPNFPLLYHPSTQEESAILNGFACKSTNEATRGIILLSKGVTMVVGRPILKSDGTGPSRGTLIMGRYLGESWVKRLISLTNFYITAYPLNQMELPSDVKNMIPALLSSPIRLDTSKKDILVSYLLMNDVFKKPAVVFRVEMPRVIRFQSLFTYSLLTITYLSTFFLTALVTLLLLQTLVVSPINHVNKIIEKGNLLKKGQVSGKDELERLQQAVKEILKELEHHPQPPQSSSI